jgi:hypothetical protein
VVRDHQEGQEDAQVVDVGDACRARRADDVELLSHRAHPVDSARAGWNRGQSGTAGAAPLTNSLMAMGGSLPSAAARRIDHAGADHRERGRSRPSSDRRMDGRAATCHLVIALSPGHGVILCARVVSGAVTGVMWSRCTRCGSRHRDRPGVRSRSRWRALSDPQWTATPRAVLRWCPLLTASGIVLLAMSGDPATTLVACAV